MKIKVINNAEIIVDRLILQYKEYKNLIEEMKLLEQQYVKAVASISKKEKLNPIKVMSNFINYPILITLKTKLDILIKDSEQISDEMTFRNPIVWMMYKSKAYRGTVKEISNWQEFKDHCKPEGYICTQRYMFIRDYLRLNYSVDLDNIDSFPNNKSLAKIYSSRIFLNLINDYSFMKSWQENEYNKTNGIVNKWFTKISNK